MTDISFDETLIRAIRLDAQAIMREIHDMVSNNPSTNEDALKTLLQLEEVAIGVHKSLEALAHIQLRKLQQHSGADATIAKKALGRSLAARHYSNKKPR